jgi:hypothetical protein
MIEKPEARSQPEGKSRSNQRYRQRAAGEKGVFSQARQEFYIHAKALADLELDRLLCCGKHARVGWDTYSEVQPIEMRASIKKIRKLLSGAGLVADSIFSQGDGKFAGAFIRAPKPAV